MAPQTRRMTFPSVVIERDTDSEPSSSDEEEEEEEDDHEEEEKVVENKNEERKMEDSLDAKKKGKTPITISLKKVCKVKEALPLPYRVFSKSHIFFLVYLFFYLFIIFVSVCARVCVCVFG